MIRTITFDFADGIPETRKRWAHFVADEISEELGAAGALHNFTERFVQRMIDSVAMRGYRCVVSADRVENTPTLYEVDLRVRISPLVTGTIAGRTNHAADAARYAQVALDANRAAREEPNAYAAASVTTEGPSRPVAPGRQVVLMRIAQGTSLNVADGVSLDENGTRVRTALAGEAPIGIVHEVSAQAVTDPVTNVTRTEVMAWIDLRAVPRNLEGIVSSGPLPRMWHPMNTFALARLAQMAEIGEIGAPEIGFADGRVSGEHQCVIVLHMRWPHVQHLLRDTSSGKALVGLGNDYERYEHAEFVSGRWMELAQHYRDTSKAQTIKGRLGELEIMLGRLGDEIHELNTRIEMGESPDAPRFAGVEFIKR